MNPEELIKMMTSLNYEFVAIKKFNDFYHPKLSHRLYAKLSLATILTKIGITLQNLLCSLNLLEYAGAAFIAFKKYPSDNLQTKLKRQGFKCLLLPKNPYL